MNNEKELTHIDLFSGIGGFTLAGEWAGFKTIVFCEKEKFCQKVLKKRFGAIAYTDNRRQSRNLREAVSRRKDKTIPDSKSSSRNSRGRGIFRPLLIPEIRDFDGTKYRGATLLTGGFPCQPFSVAGQRRGKEDDRYLWPEMLRVIGEAKPHWILAENVPGIFHMALDTVLSDLEGEGYTTGTFIIPACGLNAPHRRNRIWIVANSRCPHGKGTENKEKLKRSILEEKNASLLERSIKNDELRHASDTECERPISSKHKKRTRPKERISERFDSHASDSGNQRLQGSKRSETFQERQKKSHGSIIECDRSSAWQEDWYEVAARFCRVDDGISDRIHRLKALGNAIVPQIAYEILKNIAWIENEINSVA